MAQYYLFLIFLFATPLLFSQTADTLIAENYNDNSHHWTVETTDDYELNITDGAYRFNTKVKNSAFVSKKYIEIDTEKDFVIEADFALKSKRMGVEYGLIWGANDSCEYNFLIDAQGRFCVQQWVGGYFDFLIQWSAISTINTGIDQVNRLSVRKENLNLKFYINNKYVGRAAFSHFFGNYMGFVAGNKVEIEIDSFVVVQKNNRYPNYKTAGNLQVDTAYFITTGDDDTMNIDEKGYIIITLRNKSHIPSYDVEALLIPVNSPDDIYYDNVLFLDTITHRSKITFAFEFEPTYFMSNAERRFRIIISEANSTETISKDVYFSTANQFTPSITSPTPNQKHKYLEVFLVGIPLAMFVLIALF